MQNSSDYLQVAPEVQEALDAGKGVVALESTIIAHGMPYPQNVETAFEVEAVVREAGAIPATIAVIGGVIKIGLSEEEIVRIGKGGKSVLKLSKKDLPLAISRGVDGATTVAATMYAAAKAGIRVFATGGIGGVHRGAGESHDISADLCELAESPVAVVCAGAKSILDLSGTLELLETMSVPVLGYQTEEFPAFYCRESGLKVQHRMESAEEVRKFLKAKWSLDDCGGVVIANPIPEGDALDSEEMEREISRALAAADAAGVRGKEVTPFLLAEIAKVTQGRSLVANIALVKNNARVAALLC